MQALTSGDAEEIKECMDMLLASHAGTDYMHESINADDPEDYTRSWFAWANSLFAELLIRVKELGIYCLLYTSGRRKRGCFRNHLLFSVYPCTGTEILDRISAVFKMALRRFSVLEV